MCLSPDYVKLLSYVYSRHRAKKFKFNWIWWESCCFRTINLLVLWCCEWRLEYCRHSSFFLALIFGSIDTQCILYYKMLWVFICATQCIVYSQYVLLWWPRHITSDSIEHGMMRMTQFVDVKKTAYILCVCSFGRCMVNRQSIYC